MSSPCAFQRLARCRVRSLVSCFYACRFPLEESSDQIPGSKECSEAVRGESVESSSQTNMNIGDCEPSFAEEDYIVFCFKEDGAIHMINEPNSCHDQSHQRASVTASPPSLRRTNRKLQYRECVGLKWDSNKGGIMNADDQKFLQKAVDEIPILQTEDDEKGSGETEYIDDDDETKEINTVNEQHTNSSSKMDSFESCDSNLSDTSSSSFAFPVLGIEWIGSPVHMPKSKNEDTPSTVCLNCCRF